MMNKITFIKGQGGVPKTLPGEDHISGFMCYMADADLPAGFSPTKRIKSYGTIESAEADGIIATADKWIVKAVYYHIKEFFRMNPGGTLWLGLFKTPVSAYDYKEIKTMQTAASSKIRQMAVYTPEKNVAALEITALQAVATALDSEDRPLSILLGANVETLVGLPEIAAIGQRNVSVVIAQDSEGLAKEIITDTNAVGSLTCLGLALGALSFASVHESIAWVMKFPSGISAPSFADGSLVTETDSSVLESLNDNRYIFLRIHGGLAGSFWNDSHTMDIATSDYAYIESVRTMDKAIRGIRTYLLPHLSGPLYVDPASGKLAADTVSFLELTAGLALEDMEKAGELSGYQVSVDSEQNVLASSEVEFVIKQVGVGVMRKMKVKIGFTTSLS